eukprot:CAMPEP_0197835270 /NCGR_PEP_ID=MMETSP1437-20131217/25280_1 /TAXON_ID=49252 ORGANISM="Eucampia antarctica, Strain CCMP1452" /NCGR_SAMPLE_ID=MMETSP1437 /ASSEMBLY_ACC=CAM_ASM_001096 /LENGTH=1019 /DNA_ID=CAMNT_0043440573 /DNA_START=48 /DNA_END=3107 /DNA_ORIENTATION=+
MDDDDLAATLERAASMLAELGDPSSHHHHHVERAMTLSPKSYYELHMRALEEMPHLEDFLMSMTEDDPDSMRDLYQAAQYCPKVVPRLYLQICAGSVLMRASHTHPHAHLNTRQVLLELANAVKCVQCPVRGLFLRHYLLQATRDKLPDSPPDLADAQHHQFLQQQQDVDNDNNDPNAGLDHDSKSNSQDEPAQESKNPVGTVKDSYEFVLNNFIEMNKLWVRIQHMPASPNNTYTLSVSANPYTYQDPQHQQQRPDKEARKKRERERNELRILVGTNLERLSKLDGVTANIYGTAILPTILEQISVCRDALAQAYLMDCIIQVFPDEYHIQTLDLFLSVCPKLRDKVNVRTILTAIMERLANYYADEILLNEPHTNQTNHGDNQKTLHNDAFQIFHDCIQAVFQARGPNMPAKEIIRLQTALLNFSLKCYPSRMDHLSLCLQTCVMSLTGKTTPKQNSLPLKPLDSVAVDELEKLLSIPLDTLALRVLDLDHYSDLLTFLPWDNRKQVAVVLLKAVEASNTILQDLHQITQLFHIILPLIQTEEAAYIEQHQQHSGRGEHSNIDNIANSIKKADLLDSLGVREPSTSLFFRRDSVRSNDKACEELTAMLREEQFLLAKLVHLLHSQDTDQHFEMLNIARIFLSKGVKERRALALPPLIFCALDLVKRVMLLEFPNNNNNNNSTHALDRTTMAPEPTTDEQKSKLEQIQENETEHIETDVEEQNTDIESNDNHNTNNNTENEEVPTTDETQEKGDFAPTFSKKITTRKIFVFLQKTVSMMFGTDAETTFKLYLQVASVANQCADAVKLQSPDSRNRSNEFSTVAYELMTQAFLVYEDEVTDSKTQQRAIVSMIATLLSCKNFEKDDYEALITKTTQYAAKQLKKADQCKMVILCSHLFYTGGEDVPNAYRNPQRVLECLQRSLKIADACTMASPANVQLFVDILDRYVFHYEMDNPVISSNFVSGLIALITENMESIDAEQTESVAINQANNQFNQIVKYIVEKKNNPSTAARFKLIEC